MYEHDPLTHAIIGRAIEVHRHLGPGLFESTYEEALCIELKEADISFTRQIRVPVLYKGHIIGEHRPDLVVAERVLVEIKSVERLIEVHRAQTLAYMRVLRLPVGLLMNFNSATLRTGIGKVRHLVSRRSTAAEGGTHHTSGRKQIVAATDDPICLRPLVRCGSGLLRRPPVERP